MKKVPNGIQYEIRKTEGGYEAVILKNGHESFISETMPWYHPTILPAILTGKVVKTTD